MFKRIFTALSALALGLSIAASTAYAQPYGKGGNYSMAPAPEVASQEQRTPKPLASRCNCPMMNGGAAMREQCMAMMGRDGEQSKPAG